MCAITSCAGAHLCAKVFQCGLQKFVTSLVLMCASSVSMKCALVQYHTVSSVHLCVVVFNVFGASVPK